MPFRVQKFNWDTLAQIDPMWAVLSEPDKRGNRWDRGEFFYTGRQEAAQLLTDLETLGLPDSYGRVLDMGCGAGRVTHALAERFDEVVGYDISPTMLELAREDAADNERFVLNESNDLSPFDDESFDLVYCSRVLQHVDQEDVKRYLLEMTRVLAPRGTLFVQMLSHQIASTPGSRESGPDPAWEVNGHVPHYTITSVPVPTMFASLLACGLVVHQARLLDGGEGQSVASYEYVCQNL